MLMKYSHLNSGTQSLKLKITGRRTVSYSAGLPITKENGSGIQAGILTGSFASGTGEKATGAELTFMKA